MSWKRLDAEEMERAMEQTRRWTEARVGKLKPCPFCGGEAMLRGGDDMATFDAIQCGGICNDVEQPNAEKWNRRAGEDPRP